MPFQRFSSKFKFVAPIKVNLNSKNAACEEKAFFYVPVAETLMSLLEDVEVLKLMKKYSNKDPSPPGV